MIWNSFANFPFKQGDYVVVTEGDFKGIHGRVARIAGQQRVVVELFDGCLVATAYVPKEAMEKDCRYNLYKEYVRNG